MDAIFTSFYSPEDLCEMNYGELCSKLFEKYEAELGSLSNAEALLDVVWKAVQPKFRNRQKNGRVLMQELNAVLKKIHAYEYIPKKTIAQANGTFLAYNLLEEYPLFEYLFEKANGKKQLRLAETEKYFVFVFSQSHAQVYDKTSISGGTIDDFREFIKSVTGLEMQRV